MGAAGRSLISGLGVRANPPSFVRALQKSDATRGLAASERRLFNRRSFIGTPARPGLGPPRPSGAWPADLPVPVPQKCPVAGANATVIRSSSATPARLPPARILPHNVMDLQCSVLTINTCMLTTGCRGLHERGRACERNWRHAVPATSWSSPSATFAPAHCATRPISQRS